MTSRGTAWCGLVVGLSLLAAPPLLAGRTRFQPPTDAGVVPDAVVSSPTASSSGSAARASGASSSAVLSGEPEHQVHVKAPVVRPRPPAVPVRLGIPALGVRAQIVPVRTAAGGALAVPDDPRDLGWWTGSAMPWDRRGATVLAGHVDTLQDGAGALYHLEDLAPGAEVDLATSAGAARYVVVGRRVYTKGALPAQVFDQQGSSRLVLITCGGPFDTSTHHYRDNVVVFATPTP